MNAFEKRVRRTAGRELYSVRLETLQVNVGFLCNNHCTHCHVDAGPDRRELMDWKTMKQVIAAALRIKPALVDITGGAPEMNPYLKRFIRALVAEGLKTQVRTNLTILLEPNMRSMIRFYRQNGVKLVASFPCYLRREVDAVRGHGVFDRSIEALKRLNRAGYGRSPDLQLDLVFNPESDFLPADQSELEQEYTETLFNDHGIVFNNLITITNMPIGRFEKNLNRRGLAGRYDRLLRKSFNAKTIDALMCRSQISVGWDGRIHDCDFNLALGLTVDDSVPSHISEFDRSVHESRRIVTGNHCFGCTAGHGSSCGGALVQ